MRELTAWLDAPEAAAFPYRPVLAEFHRVGKHFVADGLLASLAAARERLAELPPEASVAPGRRLLDGFLDTALDKWDGRYDYPTYTALVLLAAPDAGPGTRVRDHRDRLVAMLLADLLRFEREAAAGATGLFPELRPDASLVAKRYRLALRVALPALRRLGLDHPDPGAEPGEAARLLWETVSGALDEGERQVLRLSMLPVYVSHDEYLFVRVLQAFEATFALLVVRLRSSIAALDADDEAGAVRSLGVAESALAESAPLFSLLATMQAAAFQEFRQFTEGASAIQSRGYKLVESLCRTPDAERLHSHAYRSVPEVRAGVLDGQRTLDDAYRGYRARRGDGGDVRDGLTGAMAGFASALRRWRQTHYRLAVRMLGERSGTGYTEGTPYLSAVRRIPVFDSVPTASAPDSGTEDEARAGAQAQRTAGVTVG
ncbi:tryptophan 2,3-dioxygenase [Streptomyces sp. NPDC006464]|uniref:tryptophan 2,3-dioxygenase n=1 Tax=Streptomyces sp. NPDC006464 TaxID=3154305 RepID=UPI0033ABAB87